MKTLAAALLAAATLLVARPASAELNKEQLVELLKVIDDRQRNGGDYKALAYIEQKQRDKTDTVFESVVYRRDADDKLMILFLQPKTEAGKGYLRIENNLWMYDPRTGKWERRTERERIGGTDSRRSDFDESRLAEEYEPAWKGEGKLGAFKTHILELKAKDGVDVAFPVIKLWVDVTNSNVLKREEYALSGRLMRTGYYPKWRKLYSESKKAEVWFPQEMRFFDEVDKSNQTTVLIKSVDLNSLEANLFTKAWLESKSR